MTRFILLAFFLGLALPFAASRSGIGVSLLPPRLIRHPEGRAPLLHDTVTWPKVSAAITEIEQLLKQASSTLGGQGP